MEGLFLGGVLGRPVAQPGVDAVGLLRERAPPGFGAGAALLDGGAVVEVVGPGVVRPGVEVVVAAVGELASGIAHEVGNPLAAISGSVQMLTTALEDDSAHRRLLDIILKESQRLDRTIKSFLQFARPKERSSVRFDIARLLSENVQLLINSPEVSSQHHLDDAVDRGANITRGTRCLVSRESGFGAAAPGNGFGSVCGGLFYQPPMY